jgi:tetratricopeptide (TPR) repeat protein
MWRALCLFVSWFLVLCAAGSLGWAQLPSDNCFSEAGRDSEKAIHYCSAAIASGQLTPYELVHSLNIRGWAYYRSGDYDRAIQDYNQAIDLKPDYSYAFNNRGLAYSAKHDYGRAIQDYDEAIHLKPDYALALNNRGFAYSGKGDSEQAIRNFDQAITLRGDSADTFYNRGRVYAGQGNFDRAIKDYSQAIRLKPDYLDAFKERSEAFMYKHEYEKALRDISSAIELQPRDAEAISSRDSLYYQQGDYKTAIRDFDTAIQLKPENTFTFWLRAAAYYDSGDYVAAIRDYNQVINQQPEINIKNVGEIYQCGLAYFYKGDYEGAIRDFTDVASLEPYGFYHRGLALFFMGQFARANEDFVRSGEGPYSDIWMYFAKAKLGENAEQDLRERAPRIREQLKYWPGPVIQFYLGSLTSAQVIAAAKADDLADKDPCVCDHASAAEKKVRFQYTEGAAYFYLGKGMLLRDHPEEARALFEKAVSMAAKNSDEYQAALFELGLTPDLAPKKPPQK